MKKILVRVGIISVVLCLALAVLVGLLYFDVIWFNNPSLKKYPVRGVDVSSYQGTIDWEKLSKQGIRFAFIKATEGSTHQDSCFTDNFEKAQQTDLKVGAYHFFSFDSAGKTQAANFIAKVPKAPGNLPPVVDIEPTGKKRDTPQSKEEVQAILNELLSELEAHYGKKPILYVTQFSYEQYIKGSYREHPIWIRDILSPPHLPDGVNWTFWQYSNRGRLEGYKGQEKHIDMNVFNGDEKAFEAFVQGIKQGQ